MNGGKRGCIQVLDVCEGAVYSEYSADSAYLHIANIGDARLIAAAPDLLAYVESRADAGDKTAQALVKLVRYGKHDAP
jgi:hypothetical protein